MSLGPRLAREKERLAELFCEAYDNIGRLYPDVDAVRGVPGRDAVAGVLTGAVSFPELAQQLDALGPPTPERCDSWLEHNEVAALVQRPEPSGRVGFAVVDIERMKLLRRAMLGVESPGSGSGEGEGEGEAEGSDSDSDPSSDENSSSSEEDGGDQDDPRDEPQQQPAALADHSPWVQRRHFERIVATLGAWGAAGSLQPAEMARLQQAMQRLAGRRLALGQIEFRSAMSAAHLGVLSQLGSEPARALLSRTFEAMAAGAEAVDYRVAMACLLQFCDGSVPQRLRLLLGLYAEQGDALTASEASRCLHEGAEHLRGLGRVSRLALEDASEAPDLFQRDPLLRDALWRCLPLFRLDDVAAAAAGRFLQRSAASFAALQRVWRRLLAAAPFADPLCVPQSTFCDAMQAELAEVPGRDDVLTIFALARAFPAAGDNGNEVDATAALGALATLLRQAEHRDASVLPSGDDDGSDQLILDISGVAQPGFSPAPLVERLALRRARIEAAVPAVASRLFADGDGRPVPVDKVVRMLLADAELAEAWAAFL